MTGSLELSQHLDSWTDGSESSRESALSMKLALLAKTNYLL